MKKILIVLILLSLNTMKVISQPYKSIFGITSTSWNVAYAMLEDWTLTDSLVVRNDTVINNHNYKYVQDIGFVQYGGYIREDTNSGKVWYLDKSQMHKEYLIMNLSLNVGDTFIIHKAVPPADSIRIVDSIKYINGDKRIYLSDKSITLTFEPLTFIEGIGPNAGIIFQLYQSTFPSMGSYLLCAHKDNVQSFINTSPYFNGVCYIHTGGIEEYKSENFKLKIFPNPSSNKIIINYSQLINEGDILIYNTLGQLVYEENLAKASSQKELNIQSFKTGLYKVIIREKGIIKGQVSLVKN